LPLSYSNSLVRRGKKRITEGIGLGAWGMEQGDRSQNPEFRRKAIKIEFLSNTYY
jgi:hypothetical protein